MPKPTIDEQVIDRIKHLRTLQRAARRRADAYHAQRTRPPTITIDTDSDDAPDGALFDLLDHEIGALLDLLAAKQVKQGGSVEASASSVDSPQ